MTTIKYSPADPEVEITQPHTLFTCGECGATVTSSSMQLHTDWHGNLVTRFTWAALT